MQNVFTSNIFSCRKERKKERKKEEQIERKDIFVTSKIVKDYDCNAKDDPFIGSSFSPFNL